MIPKLCFQRLLMINSDGCIMEEGTDYADNGIAGKLEMPVGSLEDCSWLCQREPDCAFWTFRVKCKYTNKLDGVGPVDNRPSTD